MQSDASTDYYKIFGFPVSFDIDTAALTQRYRQLQRSVHPDRFASATDRERRLSVQQAAFINQAFQTLKDPLLRARYLLELSGMDLNEESNTVIDAEFLMEQMELRERLEAVRDESDAHASLVELMQDIDGRIREAHDRLTRLFGASTPESLEQARTTTLQMQFLKRLEEEAQAAEEALEG